MISRVLFHCCLFHDYKWTVDKRGLHVKSIRFNNLSERIHNKKEVCLTNYEYDEYGNTIETRNYGVDGQTKTDKSGIVLYRYKRDEYGNLIELRFYGVDEQLKEDEDGIAIYRNKYDEYGNKTETKQYDKNEQKMW